jgi:hypothetical protein
METKIRPAACYFYHIPKTAGMSTWQLLEWAYAKEKICPGRMWEDIITLPKEELASYDAYRGHFLAYLERYLDRKLDTFMILRDPVSRTISHYYHVQRAPEHPFHAEARALSLAEFCVHPRTKHMVQNYQSGYLACPGRKHPQEIAAGMTAEDFASYKLQLALDPAPDEFPAPQQLYQAANDRLQSFVAVGISELLQESLALIARALSLPDPPTFSMRNVGSNRPATLDSDTIATIRANTEVDQALYDNARREFEHNLKSAFRRSSL